MVYLLFTQRHVYGKDVNSRWWLQPGLFTQNQNRVAAALASYFPFSATFTTILILYTLKYIRQGRVKCYEVGGAHWQGREGMACKSPNKI